MNDIEQRLGRTSARPRRGLHADFTANVLTKIAEHPRRGWLAHIKDTLLMKLPHKPLGIALATFGALAITGTATAATLGWQPFTVLFGGQKTANSQSRVVEVGTQNCRLQNNAFDMLTKNKTKDNTYFYRIMATSKYTDAQVTQMVRGECDLENESAQNTAAVQAITGKSINADSDLVGGFIDNTITAISGNAISFSFVNPVHDRPQTYSLKDVPIAHNVLILDKGKVITLGDLKVGDHFGYVYHATGDAKTHSETLAPWQINPNDMLVAIIMKNPADVLDALHFEQDSYGQVEQVIPCTTQPDGYCNIKQLESK